MPSPSAMELFVRKTPLTQAELVQMVEARAAQIKPHLDSIWLQKLVDYPCIRFDDLKFQRSLMDAGLEMSSFNIAHTMEQGIFGQRGIDYTENVRKFWGLTRSGDFIIAEITFEICKDKKEGKYEKPKQVRVTTATVERICEELHIDPFSIWNELGFKIEDWARRLKEKYRNASCLRDLMNADGRALAYMGKVQKK